MSQSAAEEKQSLLSACGTYPKCKPSPMCFKTLEQSETGFVQIGVLQPFHVECRTVIGPSASLTDLSCSWW